ncbi:MAG: hypothetical protein AB7N99_08685 [Simkaniaceae bacterium]
MTTWQPDAVVQIPKGTYTSNLINSSIFAAQADTNAANTRSNAANAVGMLLMDYITWANQEAQVLYKGKSGEGHEVYYDGIKDPGMDGNSNDDQQTSSIIQMFDDQSQNVEMIEKNITTTASQDASNLYQQIAMVLQNGDLTQLTTSLSTMLQSLG